MLIKAEHISSLPPNVGKKHGNSNKSFTAWDNYSRATWHTETGFVSSSKEVSGLPSLALTADCHIWCYTAKWEYDPLPGSFFDFAMASLVMTVRVISFTEPLFSTELGFTSFWLTLLGFQLISPNFAVGQTRYSWKATYWIRSNFSISLLSLKKLDSNLPYWCKGQSTQTPAGYPCNKLPSKWGSYTTFPGYKAPVRVSVNTTA